MGVRERGVSAEQAVAYRVAAHNLHQLLPHDGLLDAAGVAGVQDTPPGNAGVALANRVAKLTPDDYESALHDDRTLVRMLSVRGAAHVVPRRDATVFGPGALAGPEDSLREQLGGSWPAIEAAGWTAREALGSVIGVLTAVLADAEPRTKGQLSEALHDRLPADLEPWCDVCDVHHVPDQLLRLAGTAGVYAYGWPHGSRQTLMATDIWLGGPARRRRPRGPARARPALRPRLRAGVAAAPGRMDRDEPDRGPRPVHQARRRAGGPAPRRHPDRRARRRHRHAGRPAARRWAPGCSPRATPSSPNGTGRRCCPTRPGSVPCGVRWAAPGWCS